MSKDQEYIEEIRQKSTADLLKMLDGLKARAPVTDWPLGKEFEHIILRAFEIEGAEIVWPYPVTQLDLFPIGDAAGKQPVEQIDGVVHWDSYSFLIESKHHTTNIDVEPIAKLRNQLTRRPASCMGIVFTASEFTPAAKMLARMMHPLCVLLWSYSELRLAVDRRQMRRVAEEKFRYAVAKGVPDYNPLLDLL